MAKFTIKLSKLVNAIREGLEIEASQEIDVDDASAVAHFIIDDLGLEDHGLIVFDDVRYDDEEEDD